MKIHLKQQEIEAALKRYIAEQGINLSGKTIEISFTAGRNGAGISAEVDIEDSKEQLPLLSGDGDDTQTRPALSVVTAAAPVAPTSPEAAAPAAEEAKPEAAPAVEKTEKATSLFG